MHNVLSTSRQSALRQGIGLRILANYQSVSRGRRPGAMDGGVDARRITIHAREDFAGMRAAGRLAAEALDMITEHVHPGVSTGTLDAICHEFITAHGAVPAPL